MHIKPFGSGTNAVKYLGAYVSRPVIGDHRIVAINEHDDTVTFWWKDRDDGDRRLTTIPGEEFVRRYFRHVLPRGMRSIRYYGFCHPAAKKKRERIAFHTGQTLVIGSDEEEQIEEKREATGIPECPCCRKPMTRIARIKPDRRPCELTFRRLSSRGPPAMASYA